MLDRSDYAHFETCIDLRLPEVISMVRREAQSPPLSRYPTKSVVHFDVQGAVSRSLEFLLYLGSSMKVHPCETGGRQNSRICAHRLGKTESELCACRDIRLNRNLAEARNAPHSTHLIPEVCTCTIYSIHIISWRCRVSGPLGRLGILRSTLLLQPVDSSCYPGPGLA